MDAACRPTNGHRGGPGRPTISCHASRGRVAPVSASAASRTARVRSAQPQERQDSDGDDDCANDVHDPVPGHDLRARWRGEVPDRVVNAIHLASLSDLARSAADAPFGIAHRAHVAANSRRSSSIRPAAPPSHPNLQREAKHQDHGCREDWKGLPDAGVRLRRPERGNAEYPEDDVNGVVEHMVWDPLAMCVSLRRPRWLKARRRPGHRTVERDDGG